MSDVPANPLTLSHHKSIGPLNITKMILNDLKYQRFFLIFVLYVLVKHQTVLSYQITSSNISSNLSFDMNRLSPK